MDLTTILFYVVLGLSVVLNVVQTLLSNKLSGKVKVFGKTTQMALNQNLKDNTIMAYTVEAENRYNTPEDKENYVILAVMKILNDLDIPYSEAELKATIKRFIEYTKLVNYEEKKGNGGNKPNNEHNERNGECADSGNDTRTIASENQGNGNQDNGNGNTTCENGSEQERTSQNHKLDIY